MKKGGYFILNLYIIADVISYLVKRTHSMKTVKF